MIIKFLGTGTSTGVPQIGCQCEVCRSTDRREKRLRASVFLTTASGQNLLIDCGPDFREQILREGSPRLDALLITHSHYDHVGGIDDMRPYCHPSPFEVYCQADVAKDLRSRVPYCFKRHLYPGVPTFKLHKISAGNEFSIGADTILPLQIMHAKLSILGFKIGNLAYITDCSKMPDETLELIKGIDTLVINALRHEPHMSHMNLSEALDVINAVKPRQAYLTHLSHDMGLIDSVTAELPSNVAVATDGLSVEISD